LILQNTAVLFGQFDICFRKTPQGPDWPVIKTS